MKKKQVFRLKEERQQLYQTIKNLSFKEQKEILRKVDARIDLDWVMEKIKYYLNYIKKKLHEARYGNRVTR